MIACILIPGFELRAALRARPALALRPRRSRRRGEEPLLGPVTAAAEAVGVRPGMRMGEALATCPELVLVEHDPAAAEQEWEGILRRLEDAGFAVEPASSAASTSRRAASSGSTAASRRRSSARSPPSALPGIRARARPSAGSPPSRRRTSRGPGRS